MYMGIVASRLRRGIKVCDYCPWSRTRGLDDGSYLHCRTATLVMVCAVPVEARRALVYDQSNLPRLIAASIVGVASE